MKEKIDTAPEARTIGLPKPRSESAVSVEAAILKRRSVRHYADEPLTAAEVGQLVWAAQGTTSREGLRAAPSAGALYPLELYVVAGDVTGIHPGVYRYRPRSHSLELVKSGDRRKELSAAALHQPSVQAAPVSLVFSALFERTTKKYGQRGIRYVHMDQGHAAENVCLQAVALGLGTVVVGAFNDDALAMALALPPAERPLAIMPVGKVKGSR